MIHFISRPNTNSILNPAYSLIDE